MILSLSIQLCSVFKIFNNAPLSFFFLKVFFGTLFKLFSLVSRSPSLHQHERTHSFVYQVQIFFMQKCCQVDERVK